MAEETQLALSLSMLVLLLFIFADTGSVLPTSLSLHLKDSTLQVVEPTTVSSESVDPPLQSNMALTTADHGIRPTKLQCICTLECEFSQ